jgi:hypothetical protein
MRRVQVGAVHHANVATLQVRLDGTSSVAATEIRTRGIEFHQDQERGAD